MGSDIAQIEHPCGDALRGYERAPWRSPPTKSSSVYHERPERTQLSKSIILLFQDLRFSDSSLGILSATSWSGLWKTTITRPAAITALATSRKSPAWSPVKKRTSAITASTRFTTKFILQLRTLRMRGRLRA